MNKTKISSRGQTVIPRHIRKQYHWREGSRIEWLPFGETSIIARKSTSTKKRARNLKTLRQRIARYVKKSDSVSEIRSMREEL